MPSVIISKIFLDRIMTCDLNVCLIIIIAKKKRGSRLKIKYLICFCWTPSIFPLSVNIEQLLSCQILALLKRLELFCVYPFEQLPSNDCPQWTEVHNPPNVKAFGFIKHLYSILNCAFSEGLLDIASCFSYFTSHFELIEAIFKNR